jgi:hypothetical protein
MAFDWLSGEGAGELAAQEFLNKREQDRARTSILEDRNYYDSLASQAGLKQSQFNLKKQEFEFEQERKAVRQQEQERSLAMQAFKANEPSRKAGLEADSDMGIAEQFEAAGKAILGLNPKQATEYFKTANEYKKFAVNKVGDDLDNKIKQNTLAGEIASSVVDAESASAARAQLAGLGIVVPEKFTQWNEDSAKFWENRATFSKNYVNKIKLQNDTMKTQIEIENKQSLIESRNIKNKETEAKQARAQEKVKLAALNYKPSKEANKEYKREADLLAETDEVFSNLSDNERLDAAKNVVSLAQRLVVEGQASDRQSAMVQARRIIKESFGEDGKPDVIATTVTPPAGAIDMLKKNPALKQAFDEKYGAGSADKYLGK